MTSTDGIPPAAIRDPLERARRADAQMWRAKTGRLALRDERDQALRDAVVDGWSPEDAARAVNLPAALVRTVISAGVGAAGSPVVDLSGSGPPALPTVVDLAGAAPWEPADPQPSATAP